MPGFFWRLREFFNIEKRHPNNYIAGNDGQIYCVRDSKLGRLVLKANRVPTLDTVMEGFEFALPKIPGKMLEVAISFFQAYWNDDEQYEAMLRIVYDTVENKYLFDCPEQYVTSQQVHAPTVGRDYPEPRYLDVMHIHSHHVLPAIFSTIDDNNERKYRLYVVVGNMRSKVPDVNVRVGHGGSYIYLPLSYIFDSPDLTVRSLPYPTEWDQCVELVK